MITGWFGTAVIAFTASAIFAALIYQFGLWMVAVISVFAFIVIIKSFTYHRSQEKKKTLAQKLLASTIAIPEEKAIAEIKKRTCDNLALVNELFVQSLDGLVKEQKKPLKKTRKALQEFAEKNEQFKSNLINYIHKIEGDGRKARELYLSIFDLEQDLQQSIELITNSAYDHVKNLHSPLKKSQVNGLKSLTEDMDTYLRQTVETIDFRSAENIEKFNSDKKNIQLRISDLLDLQIKEVRKKKTSKRNSTLFFNLVLEARDVVSTTQHLVMVFNSSNAIEDLLDEEIG